MDDDKVSWREWLGFHDYPDFRKSRLFGAFLGVVLSLLAVFAASFVLFAFYRLCTAILDPNEHEAARSIGLVLAGIIGVPFVAWRSMVAQKQVNVAEQGHLTDRINKAVEGLGAEKTVKIHDEAASKTVERTKPNIEVRVGAIYALERIAQDSDRDHVRIMEILCAYIRENAPAREAERHEFGVLGPRKEDATDEERAAHAAAFVDKFGKPFGEAFVGRFAKLLLEETVDRFGKLSGEDGKLTKWAKALKKPTIDISAAIEVIGRRTDWQTGLEKEARGRGDALGYRLDLRATNLQAAELSRLNLKDAILTGTYLQGANLVEVHLEGAELWEAHLEGADLRCAHLEGAVLGGAHLEGADLRGANLERAVLAGAHLEGAELWKAHLEGANFRGANVEGAHLGGAHLEGAELWEAHLERANLRGAFLEGAKLWMAHLEGADLGGAHLEGASVMGAHFDDRSDFRPASLRGAALLSVTLTMPRVNLDLLTEAFGDATVTLPVGWEAGEDKLGHWSAKDLDGDEFETAWRKHQADIGYLPPNP